MSMRDGIIGWIERHPQPPCEATRRPLNDFIMPLLASTKKELEKSMIILVPGDIPDDQVEAYARKRLREIIAKFPDKEQP